MNGRRERLTLVAIKAALIRQFMVLFMAKATSAAIAANLLDDRALATIEQFRYLVLFISGFTYLFDTVEFFTS